MENGAELNFGVEKKETTARSKCTGSPNANANTNVAAVAVCWIKAKYL